MTIKDDIEKRFSNNVAPVPFEKLEFEDIVISYLEFMLQRIESLELSINERRKKNL